jgi:uncharacterized protein (DUF488 family)
MPNPGVNFEGDAEASRRALLTIGYGGDRTSEELVALLRRYGVRYLVDVRSKPYSKHRPEFSREAIDAILKASGITYVFMGDSLGGMPADPSCYTDGKVDYTKIGAREWFHRGIGRLEDGWRGGHGLAIMCAELEPERCHRSKLIGAALEARGIPVGHVDEDGAVLCQSAVLDRLTRGQGVLFDPGMTSRKRYRAADLDKEVA